MKIPTTDAEIEEYLELLKHFTAEQAALILEQREKEKSQRSLEKVCRVAKEQEMDYALRKSAWETNAALGVLFFSPLMGLFALCYKPQPPATQIAALIQAVIHLLSVAQTGSLQTRLSALGDLGPMIVQLKRTNQWANGSRLVCLAIRDYIRVCRQLKVKPAV